MKFTALVFTMFLAVFVSAAQSIGESELGKIRSGYGVDPATRAITNILTNDPDIRKNALNRELQGKVDHYYKYRVNVSGITNQKSSGRCWMFTSLNVLRPSVMEKYNVSSFEFSHNYLYFWDMLEKSNLFLENVIRTAGLPYEDREVEHYFLNPVNEGGVWNSYYNLAVKYGVVPESAMPETEHSSSTGQFRSLLREKLRREGAILREMVADRKKQKEIREYKVTALADVYRLLCLCLGEPPAEFTWRYKDRGGNIVARTYTPLEFYAEVTPGDYDADSYIMIMNDPLRDYYKVYELENSRNMAEGLNWRYLNLPNDVIKTAALASIKADEAMYASCDVGKQHNRGTGIMDPGMYDYQSLLGISMDMDKKTRILTRQSGSAHAMTLIGCDTDENDVPVKWEFENSWGTSAGNNGYLTFTDDWFDEYMFRFVIHRRHLDGDALEALTQVPVMLPVWDYMQ